MFLPEIALIQTMEFHSGALHWENVLIAGNTALLILAAQSDNSKKWAQNAFMLFFVSCLRKSLGGLIALDRTLESRVRCGAYNLIFVNGAHVNTLQLVLLWGLNNIWVCGTGVVQRSCLWQAHPTWVACPSLPAQLHCTRSQLDCPNSVTSSLFILGQVINPLSPFPHQQR